jgi:hypothetical protein
MTTPKPDRVRPGGLMRCCLETIRDRYQDESAQVAIEGQCLQCKYSASPTHRMIFRKGAWEWYRENASLRVPLWYVRKVD